ncbi:MAG TPA: alkaline phosphatase family protein [Aggregatilineales bacterium]|nr:alkaline phosphatase family protein [Aggregatilineales bacterium]
MRRMQLVCALVLVGFLAFGPLPGPAAQADGASSLGAIKTVFVIVMENMNWSSIVDSRSAPYINKTLLPMSAYATQYYNPPHIHPSLPNYLWLEAGTNFGILDDAGPRNHRQSTPQHLVTLLDNAAVSWRTYQEDIKGGSCPLNNAGQYAVKHNPFVYFTDVSGDPPGADSTNCIQHVVPFTQLADDLTSNGVARYNFITPNLCDDMHDSSGCTTPDSIANGDEWLSKQVPPILASKAYQDSGALFITWDEGIGGDGPIGMIVVSPLGKGGGYSNTIHYTHGSTLRTIEEIFGVSPFLGDAANQDDLSDLFNLPAAAGTGTPAPTQAGS